MLAERNRLALELHDAVSQKLFSLVLTAEAAGTLLERDPGAARAHVERLQELAREALEELRSLILELRPPELERDGLCGALRKHVEMLRRLHRVEIDARRRRRGRRRRRPRATARSCASPRRRCRTRSATPAPARVGVRLGRRDGRLVLEVADDGAGFDPADPELRSRRLGLTSMEERAQRLGGRLDDPLGAGRGDDGAAGGARWLTRRSASCSSTTTRSCARGCAPSSSSRTGSRSSARPPTASEGVAAAERLRPDVVLMDLVMPRLDGVGAMRELRRRLPAARVIVLTSFTDDDEAAARPIQAGAAGYLLKNAEPQRDRPRGPRRARRRGAARPGGRRAAARLDRPARRARRPASR